MALRCLPNGSLTVMLAFQTPSIAGRKKTIIHESVEINRTSSHPRKFNTGQRMKGLLELSVRMCMSGSRVWSRSQTKCDD